MASLGTLALILALSTAIATVFAGVLGGRTQAARWTEVSRSGLFVTTGLVLAAAAVLQYAFLTLDFDLVYVHGRADTRMPLGYLLAAFWGGQEGSLLFWTAVASGLASAAAWANRDRIPEILPWYHAVAALLLAGFLVILVFASDPFRTWVVTDTPAEGEGLNPLLQTPLMTIHPPCLLGGFAAFLVPYAFGMGALLAGRAGAEWLRATRRWTLVAWLFLGAGNVLGGMWAYRELGWGGYWAWDKVENFALIPWLTASAFLHSAIIQEQRGMLKKWNIVLVSLTFLLTVFGTWMTRSGFIQSVHTFAESGIGPWFLGLLVAATLFTVGAVGARWRTLGAENRIDSPWSREAAFLFNNWLLVGMAFVVLWGSVFPDVRAALSGEPTTIGPPWFNRSMAPLGALLLVVLAMGTLLPWRRATFPNLARTLSFPALVTAVGAPLLVGGWWHVRGRALGVEPVGYPAALALVTSALVVFNLATIALEFQRGVTGRIRSGSSGVPDALAHLFRRHRRRYGGYVVHLGLLFMFLALLGNWGKVESDVTLAAGDEVSIADYTVRFDRLTERDAGDHIEFEAEMTLLRAGRELSRLRPARWDFNDRAALDGREPSSMKVTSEIYIRSTPLEDVYVAMLGFDERGESASFRIEVFPFTWWLWFGGLVMIAGTLVCLWPESEPSGVAARAAWVRSGAVLAGILAALALPLAALFGATDGWAQSAPGSGTQADAGGTLEDAPPSERDHGGGGLNIHLDPEQARVARSAFELVMTTCGGCAGKTLAQASPSCYPSNQDRRRIRQMAADGASLDTILHAFADERGAGSVAIPLDASQRRTSWLVPILALAGGVAVVLVGVRRWSRAPKPSPGPSSHATTPSAAEDDEYLARVRDEVETME